MYTVFLKKPDNVKRCGHLVAVSDDGIHGSAPCIFPYYWNGLSLYFLPNEGKRFEVTNIMWDNGVYRLNKDDILREIN